METSDSRVDERRRWNELHACVLARGIAALDGHPEHWPRLLGTACDVRSFWRQFALTTLVRGLEGVLHRVATALVGHRGGLPAEDLVQESFVQGTSRLPTFTAKDPLRAAAPLTEWWVQILTRRFVDARRRRSNTHEAVGWSADVADDDDDAEPHAGDVWAADRATADPDTTRLLDAIAASLTDVAWMILVLSTVAEATAQEIAAILTEVTGHPWTVAAVESQLRRTLARVVAEFGSDAPAREQVTDGP